MSDLENMTRRESLIFMGKAAAAAALGLETLFSFGCGEKPKEGSSSGSSPAPVPSIPKDEVLEKAEQLISQGKYDSAISILENYRSDKTPNLAARHALLADSYFGQLKEFTQRFEERGSDRYELGKMIKECNQKTKKNLNAASDLEPRYSEKKWDLYLIFNGDIKENRTIDSPVNAARSFLYSLKTQDESLFLQSTNFEEKRSDSIKKREEEIKLIRENPRAYCEGDPEKVIRSVQSFADNLKNIKIFQGEFINSGQRPRKLIEAMASHRDVIVFSQKNKDEEIILNCLSFGLNNNFYLEEKIAYILPLGSNQFKVMVVPNENYQAQQNSGNKIINEWK